MNLRIPFKKLQLISYEGAGNRTPVLDISSMIQLENFNPAIIKLFLEKNRQFRLWLKKEGRKQYADSIMIYYQVNNSEYDYVTFIGEPNASINSSFSEMCGNGIRSLALHIGLKNKLEENQEIKILAGSIKKIKIKSINFLNKNAEIMVNMGKFYSGENFSKKFINRNRLDENCMSIKITNIPCDILQNKYFGFGFNGDENNGEPHLVILFTINEFQKVFNDLFREISFNRRTLISSLRLFVVLLGNILTFDTNLFPKGININCGVVYQDKIYLSTHERNILSSRRLCRLSQNIQGICRCNTLACGTGGAAAANIAYRQKYIHTKEIITIHPGGEIIYELKNNTTYMIGPAQKI